MTYSVFRCLLEPRKKAPGMKENRFTNAMLAAMVVPLVVEQFLQMIVGIADTLMVSYAGEAVVSGVSLVNMIVTFFTMVFQAASAGGAVIISQYVGRAQRKRAEKESGKDGRAEDEAKKDWIGAKNASGQVFQVCALVSVLSTFLMLLGGDMILNVFYSSVETEVMEACRTYLWIVTLSFPACGIYNAGVAMYRSIGKTRTTMLVSIAMNLMNVIGNAVGIFGLHAGAAGVAWPTTISWYAAAIVMTVLCFRLEDLRLEARRIVRKDFEMCRRVLHVGFPNMVENGLFQAAKVYLGTLVAALGTVQIAANGIGQTFWSLGALVSLSMSPAFITVVGQCMGAGAPDEAEYYMRKMLRMTYMMAIVWDAFCIALAPVLLMFFNISKETSELTFATIIIHNIFAATVQPMAGALSAGLRATGDVRYNMMTSLLATVVCRTLLSLLFVLVFRMGVIGIALAMVLDWVVKAVCTIIRFRSGKWRRFRLIRQED